MVTDSRGGASQKISKRRAKKHDLLVKQKKMLVTGEWQVFILDDASMGYFAVSLVHHQELLHSQAANFCTVSVNLEAPGT